MITVRVPQNWKYTKLHRKVCFKLKGISKNSKFISSKFRYGLIACEGGMLSFIQINACHKIILKNIKVKRLKRKKRQKKIIKFISSLFLQVPITKKSVGIRMGKGKGPIDYWAFPVKRGRVLFQLNDFVAPSLAYKALKEAQYRLPFRTKLIIKSRNSFDIIEYEKMLELLK